MSKYEMPGMTPFERKVFGRLTDEQQRDVHYGGWSAVWDDLTETEQDGLIEEFEVYGDR